MAERCWAPRRAITACRVMDSLLTVASSRERRGPARAARGHRTAGTPWNIRDRKTREKALAPRPEIIEHMFDDSATPPLDPTEP